MRRICAIIFAVWAVCCLGSPAHAGKRVALVIGNSEYQHVPRLSNPANDAVLIAGMLKKAGFDSVTFRSDLKAAEMRRALREFGSKARDADVAVVYYAGHGIELDNANYLVPVDTLLETDTDIYDETTPLDRVLVAVEPAKQLRLIILDACRDNPFSKTMKRTVASRAIGRGLAKVEPSSPNTIIAFAAKAGFTASDGDGKNSPFALALSRHLATPGLDLRKAFGFVRDDVLKATDNKQEPYIYGSLGGDDVSLVPPKPVVAAPSVNPQADMRRDYELALQIGTRAVWTSYLNTYPSGFYADLAKGQLDRIAAEESRLAAVARSAQEEKARLAAEGAREAEQAKAAAAEQARLAAEKIAAEKAAAAKAEADAAAERKHQAAEAAKQAEQAKAAAAEQARLAAEKIAAEKAAAAKAEAEATAERKRQAAEAAKQAELAKATAERERLAAEKAAAEKAALEAREARPVEEGEGAATKAQTKMALLTPSSDQAAMPDRTPDTEALVRDIKKELQRVGCYSGTIDNNWKTAEASFGKFAKFAKLSATPEQPAPGMLDEIRGRVGRICPPECPARQTALDGRCVAKSCPAGSILNEDGSCEKRPARTASRPSPADVPSAEPGAARKNASRGSGGDATAESKHLAPPGSIRHGETVTLTARNGRKMTCTGGNNVTGARRTCVWN